MLRIFQNCMSVSNCCAQSFTPASLRLVKKLELCQNKYVCQNILASSMSVIFIRGCHPWMKFFHPWNSSMGWIVICQILTMFYKVVGQLLARIGNLCEQNMMDDNTKHGWTKLIHGWKCHPWCHPWMEKPHSCHLWISSMVNVIHGWQP